MFCSISLQRKKYPPVLSERSSWRRLCMIHRRLHRNCSQVRGPHKHHISCLPCSCGRAPDHWSLDWAILGVSLHPSGRRDCGQSAWSPLQPWCLRPYCGVGSDPLGPLGEYLQIYTGNKNVTLLFWNYWQSREICICDIADKIWPIRPGFTLISINSVDIPYINFRIKFQCE